MLSLTGKTWRADSTAVLFAEVGRDLQATVQCHSSRDIVDVAFHRVRGKLEASGDFLVVQPPGKQDDDLAFPLQDCPVNGLPGRWNFFDM